MRIDVPTGSLVKGDKALEGKWWSVDLQHLSGILLEELGKLCMHLLDRNSPKR